MTALQPILVIEEYIAFEDIFVGEHCWGDTVIIEQHYEPIGDEL